MEFAYNLIVFIAS